MFATLSSEIPCSHVFVRCMTIRTPQSRSINFFNLYSLCVNCIFLFLQESFLHWLGLFNVRVAKSLNMEGSQGKINPVLACQALNSGYLDIDFSLFNILGTNSMTHWHRKIPMTIRLLDQMAYEAKMRVSPK